MRLDTISAVVTGAAGGIGSLVCRRLVERGARVLLVGRSADRLGRLASELAELPVRRGSGYAISGSPDRGQSSGRHRIDVLAVDLTLAHARQAVRDAADSRRVNVLINGAAISSFGALESLSDSHLDEVVRANLIAPIALTRLLLPTLRRAPEAAILNIGSTLGSIGLPGFTVYAAAKAGLHAFSEALRRELAGSTVRVQYLGARATQTAFNSPRVDAFNATTRTKSDPPEVVAAAAIAMLVSGRSERYLGFPEQLLVRINAVLPTLLDFGVKRHRLALSSDGNASLTTLNLKDPA